VASAEAGVLGAADRPLQRSGAELQRGVSVGAGGRNARRLAGSFSVIGVLLDHETRPTL